MLANLGNISDSLAQHFKGKTIRLNQQIISELKKKKGNVILVAVHKGSQAMIGIEANKRKFVQLGTEKEMRIRHTSRHWESRCESWKYWAKSDESATRLGNTSICTRYLSNKLVENCTRRADGNSSRFSTYLAKTTVSSFLLSLPTVRP